MAIPRLVIPTRRRRAVVDRLRRNGRRLRTRRVVVVGPWLALARVATLPACPCPSLDY